MSAGKAREDVECKPPVNSGRCGEFTVCRLLYRACGGALPDNALRCVPHPYTRRAGAMVAGRGSRPEIDPQSFHALVQRHSTDSQIGGGPSPILVVLRERGEQHAAFGLVARRAQLVVVHGSRRHRL
jgi:hypothetical protein